MSYGVQNYQGGTNVLGEVIRVGSEEYIKVYNDTGAAIADGDIYWLSFLKDADSLSPSARPTLDAVTSATAAYGNTPRLFCVVANGRFGSGAATIADQAWGFVQTKGYCPTVKTTGTVTAEDYIQGTTASQAATTDGTTITVDSFGVAVTTAASNLCEAVLFGHPVNFTT